MVDKAKQILVRSIEFGEPPFRKLGNLRIDIADRMTLIAGHNGIGKSTILGLLSNTFGLTDKDGPRSYFGEHFYANIEKIVYLSLSEVDLAQQGLSAPPVVSANVGGVEVRKRSAMTKRAVEKRARVVPRTVDKAEDDPVGPDAKIPLPTIYLGIKRLASIGEADDKEVASRALDMDQADKELMAAFVSAVILGVQVTQDVTQTTIKGSKKRTAQPGYANHEALAVSMGQDSLGSIATALASFNRLKRELGDEYQGGLLVVDELDVGFHPHAIGRLIENLKTYAKRLNLQVIATTHSPLMIEAVHPEGGGEELAPDRVVYLVDTLRPRVAENQSLKAILEDMSLAETMPTKAKKPQMGVYFEDKEGVQFFEALLPAAKRTAMGKRYGVLLKPIGLGVGGSNLLQLPDSDPMFKNRLLLVDADTKISQKAKNRGNAVKLPCPAGVAGVLRSPENLIIAFLKGLAQSKNGALYDLMLRLNVANPSGDKIAAKFFPGGFDMSTKRDVTKAWWKKNLKAMKDWGVLDLWIEHNQAIVDEFLVELEQAIKQTSTRLR